MSLKPKLHHSVYNVSMCTSSTESLREGNIGERERDRERQRKRERQRQRDRETETERERERDRGKETERETVTERERVLLLFLFRSQVTCFKRATQNRASLYYFIGKLDQCISA